MQTGLISIDSMIPIGHGQSELIVGDTIHLHLHLLCINLSLIAANPSLVVCVFGFYEPGGCDCKHSKRSF